MYEEFFGLKRSPFELSPDPFFLFSSEKSQEAMASISYAVCRRKGFVVMTGEVGTGKTLILRCLFELWEREQIPFAYFIGPRLSTVDFLSYIAFELGLQVAEPTKGNLLRVLYGFLLAQYERGLTTVLVIDEAHQMPRSVLEEIRLLTNFETAQQKLVQIVLVGQPELEKKLDSVELRSLKQRIAVRCRLEPLSGGETGEYIGRRLELAGLKSPAATIFPAETVAAIHRYAQGIPRLVNSICNQALLAAYARRVRVVPIAIVDEVAAHFRLNSASDLKPTEKPFTLAGQHKTWQALPTLNAPIAPIAQEQPDESAVIMPAQPLAAPREPEPFVEDRHHDGFTADNFVDHMHEVLIRSEIELPNEKQGVVCSPSEPFAVSDGSVSVATSSVAGAPAPTLEPSVLAERVLAESITPVSTANQLTPCEPLEGHALDCQPPDCQQVIGQTGAFHDTLQATSPSNHVLRTTWSTLRRLRSAPAIRIGFFTGGTLVVAVALATGVIMARHSIGATSVPHQVVTTWGSVPADAAGPVEPAVATSAVQATVQVAMKSAEPIVPTDSLAPKSTATPQRLTPRTKITTNTLSRPVLRASRPSISTEPPPAMGFQTNDPQIGKSLLDIFASSPTPPSAITGGQLQAPKLLSSVPPAYPSRALMEKVQGVVVINALIDNTGKVADMKVTSGPARLIDAALNAVRLWKYQPAQLDGQPIATHIQVSVNFSLH